MREDILNNIVEKMATDPDFLKNLEAKPGKALVDAGLTWEEVAEIKKTAEGPQTEALGERSSAGFTAVGELWFKMTGQCGCQSSWISSAPGARATVPFCT